MKRKAKGIICLILAALMLLSLAACGKGGDTPPAAGSPKGEKGGKTSGGSKTAEEYVYTADVKTLVDDGKTQIQPQFITDTGFYSYGNEVVGDATPEGVTPAYVGQYAIYEPKMYFVSFDGEITPLADFKAPGGGRDASGLKDYKSNISLLGQNAINITPEGNIALTESVYEQWYEGPDGISPESGDYYNYVVNANNAYIRVLSPTGQELSSAAIDNEGGSLATFGMCVRPDGRVVAPATNCVNIINTQGKSEKSIPLNCNWIEQVINTWDGNNAVIYTDANGVRQLSVIDADSGNILQTYDLSEIRGYIMYPGNKEFPFVYSDGSNLYGYDTAQAAPVKILNWINSGINGGNQLMLKAGDDGQFDIVTAEYVSGGDALSYSYAVDYARVSKVPASSLPKKEVLTLGALQAGNTDAKLILAFNRSHDDCRIEVKDYSEFVTADDRNGGRDKMLAALTAGDVPDIIYMRGLPLKQLAAKGLLEDLYPYLDKDPELSRDDIFPSVLKSLELNGALYSAVARFTVNAMVGSSTVVGDNIGWTFDQLDSALASMPEGCYVANATMPREQILRYLLWANMDALVNWGTGECSFDSDGFIRLLELSKGFRAEDELNSPDFDYAALSPDTLIPQGMQLLDMANIFSFNDIFFPTRFFNGAYTYVGLPTIDGSAGNIMNPMDEYSISSRCKNKDMAWQFVRQIFTQDYQNTKTDLGFGSNINSYLQQQAKAMTPDYKQDENGNILLDENGEKIPIPRMATKTYSGEKEEFFALGQDDADKLWQLISGGIKRSSEGEAIVDMIIQETQGYFMGDKTAQETANIIQSKMSIYINEQR